MRRPQLLAAEAQPSGVRLVFRTAATAVELDTLPHEAAFVGVPPRPDGVYDLLVDGELVGRSDLAPAANVVALDLATGGAETRPGPVGTVRFTGLPARDKDVEIWLPHNEITELVALRTDAPVEAVPPGGRRCGCTTAARSARAPTRRARRTTWPALAAAARRRRSGQPRASAAARCSTRSSRARCATPPADLVSVKIGINLVNADVMRLRAFAPAVHGFLDTIRDGHPTRRCWWSARALPDPRGHPGPGRARLRRARRGRCASAPPVTRPSVAAGQADTAR